MDELNENEFDQEIPTETEETEEEEHLSVVEKLIGVYVSPASTFRYLSKRPDFWMALLIFSLILIGFTMATLPKLMPVLQTAQITAVQEQFEESGMSEKEIDETISTMKNVLPIVTYAQTIIGIPIGLAIGWLLATVLVFFISMIQGLDTDFKRLLGMLPWLSAITILSEIGKSVVLIVKGISSMEQMQDGRYLKPFSAAALIPESADVPAWLPTFLSTIDPFFIWSIFVMVLVLEAANRCTRAQAITTTIIATIISLAAIFGLSMLGAVFTQMAPG